MPVLAACTLLLLWLQTADAIFLPKSVKVSKSAPHMEFGNVMVSVAWHLLCTLLLPGQPVGAFKSKWDWQQPWEVEDWAQHLEAGNVLAGVAWQLLKSEECSALDHSFVVPDVAGRRKEVEKHGSSKFIYLDAMDQLFGLPFISKGSQATPCFREMFQDTTEHIADFPPWNITSSVFRRRLYPQLKQQTLLALRRAQLWDALVVHLRGGDIMPRGDLDYLPAPCTFVDRVIKAGRAGLPYGKIIMVSDSHDHPCVNYVKARHPTAYFKLHTAIEDLYTLISAQNVVLSTSSTFGLAATFLNPGTDRRIFLPTYSGHGLCCEGNFNPTRLSELCHISRYAQIWEFNPPDHKYCRNRTAWITEDKNVKNITVHRCS